MTSEKALELLKQRIIAGKGKKDFDLLYKKYCDVIKKDLEVLETFKNSLTVERMPPKPFDPNEEFNFDSYIQYIIKYNTYIFDKNIREKLTQWIIDNIDKETVRKWLENGSD